MKNRLLTPLIVLAGMLAGQACAESPLEVSKAWVRAAPPGTMMLAAYAGLRNPGESEIRLSEARSDAFGFVEIHRTVEEDGVSRMRAAGVLTLAPGASLTLEPGGLHLMLMRPRRTLAEGDSIVIELDLEDGRSVAAEFVVARQAP